MARISTYALDNNVTKHDKVIGSDSSGLVTKNFNLKDIAGVVNQEITIPGTLVYQFKENITHGSLTGLNDGDSFSSLTSIRLSEVDFPGQNVQNLIQEFKKKRILLISISDKNKYGIFDIQNIQEDVNNLDYYIFSLNFISGNSTLTFDDFYMLSLYPKDADKHHVHKHNQNTAASTWNVAHNLGKFPSATMVLSTGQKGYGDINYIDENNLTITFASAETGKAYIN